MANQKNPMKFDHREIAVIFSLFVFVTLLMFTVGILVGKGLTQAKYEGKLGMESLHSSLKDAHLPPSEHGAEEEAGHEAATGTSVSTEHPAAHAGESKHGEEAKDEEAPASDEHAENHEGPKHDSLQLVPKSKTKPNVYSGSLTGSLKAETEEKLLSNPKIKELLEDSDHSGHSKPSRKTASIPDVKVPISFEKGPYTVQVGSYPNEKDASLRVDSLKKLGFDHAYFSAKELEKDKGVWYRVWLGYFPTYDSAKKNAEFLQKRGEVKNYLVRKTSESLG